MTLSQIYDWMIASVPYFAQRADSSSAAGWKVNADRKQIVEALELKIGLRREIKWTGAIVGGQRYCLTAIRNLLLRHQTFSVRRCNFLFVAMAS